MRVRGEAGGDEGVGGLKKKKSVLTAAIKMLMLSSIDRKCFNWIIKCVCIVIINESGC